MLRFFILILIEIEGIKKSKQNKQNLNGKTCVIEQLHLNKYLYQKHTYYNYFKAQN